MLHYSSEDSLQGLLERSATRKTERRANPGFRSVPQRIEIVAKQVVADALIDCAAGQRVVEQPGTDSHCGSARD